MVEDVNMMIISIYITLNRASLKEVLHAANHTILMKEITLK